MRGGLPLRVPVRSSSSVLVVEPTLGIDASQPSVDAPLGSTPRSANYIMRDGALEPRQMLTLLGSSPHILGNDPIIGAYEVVSVANSRFPIVSGTTRMAVYGQASTPNGWSVLSYVSAGGIDAAPGLASTDEYWDFCQIYSATRDENWAIGFVGSYQTAYVTQSDTTVFSTLTGAPRAKYGASLDNYVMAFNLREGTADYVQRVQWSDRGSPTFTGGLSGFEDLLSAKGEGKRVMVQDNRFVLFFDEEIWQGVQGNSVFPWQFAPYDTSRGCPYSRTITSTPLGIVFLGKDYQVYLLPKGGGPSVAIGQRLHRSIRNQIDQPGRAWAVYNNTLGQYQLHYAIRGGSGHPQRAVYLDINTGSWAPQSFDETAGNLSVTAGCEIQVSSSATTYGGAGAASLRYADVGLSYSEMGGTSEQRSILVGSSKGTLYTFDSNATSDNGTAVPCYWQSTGLAGTDPAKQKTVREFRVDYQGDSSSSLTIRFSQNLGGSYGYETQINLPASSGMSQAIAYPYLPARYPSFEIRSEGQRHRIHRFWVEMREQGR